MSLNPAAGAASDLEQLRSERGLRALTKTEEGSDIYRLPNGVFGFSYAPGLKEVPVYSKQHYHGFEIHRLSNGEVHLIGFVTPEEKAQMAAATLAVQVMIFPEHWKESTELVSVADTCLQPAKKSVSRQDGNPFKTLVSPAPQASRL
jgi:hypothetical protein